MAHADWEQIEREISEAQYMRYAAGGLAWAATAARASDGTFLAAKTGPACSEDGEL